MKPLHTNASKHQQNLITMKSTQYLTYLKTILLILPSTLYLSNPTSVHAGDRKGLSVGFVTSGHSEYRGDLPQGFLTVYSATDRIDDGELPYYAHSSYAIYTIDGKLFKRVENHLSATDETPETVSLPTGSYIVEARSENDGYVRRLVTVKAGLRTIFNPDL